MGKEKKSDFSGPSASAEKEEEEEEGQKPPITKGVISLPRLPVGRRRRRRRRNDGSNVSSFVFVIFCLSPLLRGHRVAKKKKQDRTLTFLLQQKAVFIKGSYFCWKRFPPPISLSLSVCSSSPAGVSLSISLSFFFLLLPRSLQFCPLPPSCLTSPPSPFAV